MEQERPLSRVQSCFGRPALQACDDDRREQPEQRQQQCRWPMGHRCGAKPHRQYGETGGQQPASNGALLGRGRPLQQVFVGRCCRFPFVEKNKTQRAAKVGQYRLRVSRRLQTESTARRKPAGWMAVGAKRRWEAGLRVQSCLPILAVGLGTAAGDPSASGTACWPLLSVVLAGHRHMPGAQAARRKTALC